MLDLGSVLFGMIYVAALWLVVEGARDLKRFADSQTRGLRKDLEDGKIV